MISRHRLFSRWKDRRMGERCNGRKNFLGSEVYWSERRERTFDTLHSITARSTHAVLYLPLFHALNETRSNGTTSLVFRSSIGRYIRFIIVHYRTSLNFSRAKDRYSFLFSKIIYITFRMIPTVTRFLKSFSK